MSTVLTVYGGLCFLFVIGAIIKYIVMFFKAVIKKDATNSFKIWMKEFIVYKETPPINTVRFYVVFLIMLSLSVLYVLSTPIFTNLIGVRSLNTAPVGTYSYAAILEYKDYTERVTAEVEKYIADEYQTEIDQGYMTTTKTEYDIDLWLHKIYFSDNKYIDFDKYPDEPKIELNKRTALEIPSAEDDGEYTEIYVTLLDEHVTSELIEESPLYSPSALWQFIITCLCMLAILLMYIHAGSIHYREEIIYKLNYEK